MLYTTYLAHVAYLGYSLNVTKFKKHQLIVLDVSL